MSAKQQDALVILIITPASLFLGEFTSAKSALSNESKLKLKISFEGEKNRERYVVFMVTVVLEDGIGRRRRRNEKDR